MGWCPSHREDRLIARPARRAAGCGVASPCGPRPATPRSRFSAARPGFVSASAAPATSSSTMAAAGRTCPGRCLRFARVEGQGFHIAGGPPHGSVGAVAVQASAMGRVRHHVARHEEERLRQVRVRDGQGILKRRSDAPRGAPDRGAPPPGRARARPGDAARNAGVVLPLDPACSGRRAAPRESTLPRDPGQNGARVRHGCPVGQLERRQHRVPRRFNIAVVSHRSKGVCR
jgi:hypothetical protein